MKLKYPEYAGMSYEQASREAGLVIERCGWYQGFTRLKHLRKIMNQFVPKELRDTIVFESFNMLSTGHANPPSIEERARAVLLRCIGNAEFIIKALDDNKLKIVEK